MRSAFPPPCAVGSFAISYGHIHAVLTAWHYDPIAAAIGPLVLHGLMTISGFALLNGELGYARSWPMSVRQHGESLSSRPVIHRVKVSR